MKVFHKPEDSSESDAERAKERIKREIEAMSSVLHPNLLKILDVDPEIRGFVSEYHPYGTLEDRQQAFAGNVPGALETIRPIVAGVAELHNKSIVHRDTWPIKRMQNLAHSRFGGAKPATIVYPTDAGEAQPGRRTSHRFPPEETRRESAIKSTRAFFVL